MKTNKLAVYGTLRNGKRDTWNVDGYLMLFPGHRNFPVAMVDDSQKELVVEVIDVNESDIHNYDIYEGVDAGLYERRMVKAYNDKEEIDAWMYTMGTLLMQHKNVFQMVPKKDWMCEECLNLRK